MTLTARENERRYGRNNPLVGQTVPGIGPGGWDSGALARSQSPLTGFRLVERAYRKLTHSPDCPLVRAAYQALTEELWQQFVVLSAHLSIEFSTADPYTTSRQMFADIAISRRLRVYTGGEALPQGHPLAQLAPNYQPFNNIFRAVHDALAHYPNRYSFSPLGELNAFRAHARMLSPLAGWAVATETLGQTAYYVVNKRYAPQVADLLPQSIVTAARDGGFTV